MNDLREALAALSAAADELGDEAEGLPADVLGRLTAEARKVAADLRGAAADLRRRKGIPSGIVRKARLADRINK